MTARPRAVVLASGGLDSCVAAAVAREDYDLAFCHANYGQRTVHRELTAFRAQAAFFGVNRILEADLSFLGQIGGSSLTDLSEKVPAEAEKTPGHPFHLRALSQFPFPGRGHRLGRDPGGHHHLHRHQLPGQPRGYPGLPPPPITKPSTASSPWAPAPGLTSRSRHPSFRLRQGGYRCVWASNSRRR